MPRECRVNEYLFVIPSIAHQLHGTCLDWRFPNRHADSKQLLSTYSLDGGKALAQQYLPDLDHSRDVGPHVTVARAALGLSSAVGKGIVR